MRHFEGEIATTTPDRTRPARATPRAGLLALQRAAGNHAVTAMVQRSSTAQEQGPDREIRDAGAIAGVETQPDDAGTTTGSATPSCQIDVRATKIRGLGPLPIYHLFVIYTDAAGTPYFFRGGPSGRGGPGGYGSIKCDHGRYTPGTVDWAPGAPSTTVLSGPAACGKDASFTSELARIDSAAIPYKPTGPNSNSVARTLLNKSGVPEDKPVMIAPGWGTVL